MRSPLSIKSSFLQDSGLPIDPQGVKLVYVDEQNQIRRTTIEMSLAGQGVSVAAVIEPQAETIVIENPKATDVTDLADLI